MAREFDIVVFGATGFTGQYAVEEAYKASKEEGLTFAVAGRSESKLIAVLKVVAGWLNLDPDTFARETPKIIADVSDSESLHNMAKRARIIVNTVGPYQFYGEAVVNACVDEGTSHVDISGEPIYIEGMQLKHHKNAQEKNIYIVSACGFDSIPDDFTLNFVKDSFPGRLNSVETFISLENPKGAKMNTGTWNSAVNGVATWKTLPVLRKKLHEALFTKQAEKPKFALKNRCIASTSPVAPTYTVPFIGADRDIMMKSEMFRTEYSTEEYKPVQIQTYISLDRIMYVIGLTLIGLNFAIFSQFSCGRKLLAKYPEFFSFGTFSNTTPTREQLQAKKMKIVGLGRGWHTGDDESLPPTKEIVVEMNGMDPAYIGTALMLVQSAVCILKESASMPLSGGCLSPGFAFEKTSLRRRLDERGIKWHVVRQ